MLIEFPLKKIIETCKEANKIKDDSQIFRIK